MASGSGGSSSMSHSVTSTAHMAEWAELCAWLEEEFLFEDVSSRAPPAWVHSSEADEWQRVVDAIVVPFHEEMLVHADDTLRKVVQRLEWVVQHPETPAESHSRAMLVELRREDSKFGIIRVERERFDQVIALSYEEEGWKEVNNSKGIRICWKSLPGMTLQTLRIEGDIPASALKVIAVLNEMDLWKDWVPNMRECVELARPDRARIVMHAAIAVPILSDRDCVVYGYGVDALEAHGAFVVVGETIESYEKIVFKPPRSPDSALPLPPPKKSTVRMDMPIAGFSVTPLTRDSCRLIMLSNFDPKLKLIPDWLVNWAARKVGHYSFSKMRDLCHSEKHAAEYERRMQQQPELYDEVRVRLDNYMTKKEQQQGEVSASTRS